MKIISNNNEMHQNLTNEHHTNKQTNRTNKINKEDIEGNSFHYATQPQYTIGCHTPLLSLLLPLAIFASHYQHLAISLILNGPIIMCYRITTGIPLWNSQQDYRRSDTLPQAQYVSQSAIY
jgi:hypothetical protein